ncbi:MAG: hypothetical protein P4M11_09115 [Candidatus Pacebacteria bacterium]|nr:hypothetical protein [Candidatus Paceibacterota bacterium]
MEAEPAENFREAMLDSTWQKTLANLLMEELSHTREQARIYKDQAAEVKRSSEQVVLDENRTWQQVTNTLKQNYDTELARKQKEIAQLHDLLAQWIVKYMELEKGKSREGAVLATLLSQYQEKCITGG